MLNLINLGAGGHGDGVFHSADFRFPTELEYRRAIEHGFEGFRVAHKWYRLQPAQAGPTDNLAEYKNSIATGRRLKPDAFFVIEDHSYGSAIPVKHVSGTFHDWSNRARFDHPTIHNVDSARALARFYGAAFPEFKNDRKIAFEFANEPVHVPYADTWNVQNAFFDEMRAQGFNDNTLIGTTSGWGGLTYFTAEADALKGLRCDVVSGHRYFDPGNEGNERALWNLTDADAGRADLGAIVNSKLTHEREALEAARKVGLKVFIGEYGLPNTAIGVAVVPHMLRFFKEFEDVIWGVAPWIAAEWSTGDSFAKIQGEACTPTAGMKALAEQWPKVIGGTPTPTPTPAPVPTPTPPAPDATPLKLLAGLADVAVEACKSKATRAELTAMATKWRDALRAGEGA